jgi:hypothetical protein
MIREGIRAMLEDLSDDAPADADSTTGPPITEGASAIVAGRNQLDETAGSLLVHLLRSQQSTTIARPDAVVATSLRDAVTNLHPGLSPKESPAPAVDPIRATGVSQAAMPSSTGA